MRIRVYIVDDHQLFIDGVTALLENEINIKIAGSSTSGKTLLSELESGLRINILLLDIRMPQMNGIQLCRIIKGIYPDILVIALTMCEHPDDISDMLNAGATGFVLKNIEKNDNI